MSDSRDKDSDRGMPRSESSIWDAMTSFLGFTTESGAEESGGARGGDGGSDSDSDAGSGSAGARRRGGDGAGKARKKKRERSADGGDEGGLGRRKSVWDSMREMVTGEEELAEGNGEDDESDSAEKAPPWQGKVLVTGAEGYIAGWVIKGLLEKKVPVVGTVRTLRNKPKYEHLYTLVPEVQEEDPDILELVEADLSRPMSFDRAIEKVEFVIHIAAPFKLGVRDATVGLLNPSVQGTLNVLRGVAKCDHIKRVVVTSCAVAMFGKPNDAREYSEQDWNNEATLDTYPYHLAKTEAEKQARDFVKKLPQSSKVDLVTLCPSFVVGPLLAGSKGTLNTSLRVMQDVMKGLVPYVPKMGLPLVDVRDVAKAHIDGALSGNMSGRYAVHADTMQFSEIVTILKANYSRGQFPAKEKSKFFVRRNETFQRNMPFQYIRPWLGRTPRIVNRKIRKDTGMEFMPLEKSLIDMCKSFEEFNI